MALRTRVQEAAFGPHHHSKPILCFLAAKQESAATFKEHCEVLDVDSRKIVQANFEDVENNVSWHHSEFRQV